MESKVPVKIYIGGQIHGDVFSWFVAWFLAMVHVFVSAKTIVPPKKSETELTANVLKKT